MILLSKEEKGRSREQKKVLCPITHNWSVSRIGSCFLFSPRASDFSLGGSLVSGTVKMAMGLTGRRSIIIRIGSYSTPMVWTVGLS